MARGAEPDSGVLPGTGGQAGEVVLGVPGAAQCVGQGEVQGDAKAAASAGWRTLASPSPAPGGGVKSGPRNNRKSSLSTMVALTASRCLRQTGPV